MFGFNATVDVAPFVGAWIEILLWLPLIRADRVAPFVGAWIEIPLPSVVTFVLTVAPFVGAWIEICMTLAEGKELASLRSSERGLKYNRTR